MQARGSSHAQDSRPARDGRQAQGGRQTHDVQVCQGLSLGGTLAGDMHHHAVDSLHGRLGGQRERQASACCQRVVEERGDEGGVTWTPIPFSVMNVGVLSGSSEVGVGG